MSGLHCTIPNGTSAPGKVLPPPDVQVRVSTRLARFPLAPGFWSLRLSRAPRGSREARTRLAQLAARPLEVVTQLRCSSGPCSAPIFPCC